MSSAKSPVKYRGTKNHKKCYIRVKTASDREIAKITQSSWYFVIRAFLS
jgi:hypothetical protein